TEQSLNVAKDVMLLLPLAPYEKIMPATEAEMVKYFGNNWFAVKVAFANQMYDICSKIGADYDTVMEAASADKRIGPSHLVALHKGYRGYGGKCLAGDEFVFEPTKNGMRVIPIKDFQGREIVGMKDGKIFIDKVIAIGKRQVEETIKFSFSKGKDLETSLDHLVVVFDEQKGELVEKEAKDIVLTDKVPVVVGEMPFEERGIKIDFFEMFSNKADVFVEEIDKNYVFDLKPFLSFNQYAGFKRERNMSLPAVALLEAGISLGNLRIKTGKTGTWLPNSIQLDEDFSRLIGYYLAEGCCSSDRVHFSFGYHEKELIEDLSKILNKFNIQFSGRVGKWKGKDSSYTFKVSSRILSEYFKKLGSNCYEKRIPDYIFFATQQIKDQFLAGLFRGDGFITKSNMGNYYTIGYASVSHNLIEGVDLLLREKGILAGRKDFRAKKSKVDCHEVLISENESVRKLLPLLAREKTKDLVISKRTIKSPAYKQLSENIYLLPLRKIEKINKTKTVYFLETENHYYLTSGGLLTHNCLPKDIRAFIQFGDSLGVDLKVHKATEAVNNDLMKAQNIEDPEKYSKRE
ncbi:MAG: LAGLIDADG family homing endonuclease, partial [Patescibacteria group bacterium]